jgi:hypothetical protein
MEKYAEQSLDVIKKNKLLSTEDFDDLVKIKDELNHTFAVSQVFRSRVEMEVSVLNDVKHPTPDAKYWQAIREQNVHFSELVSLSYEYRKTVQRVKIIEAEIDELKDKRERTHEKYEDKKIDAEIEINKIEIERINWVLLQMTKTAKDRIREVLNWHEIMEILKPLMKYSTDTYEDHQWVSYSLRFNKQLEAAMKTNAKIGSAEAGNLVGLHTTMERVFKERKQKESLSDPKCKQELGEGNHVTVP